jgi:uncharacterized protein (TIGR02147 family)
MVAIFNYFDYQKYLGDYYEWRKRDDSYFTYRFIASKVGIDHAFIVKVFQGQKQLSLKSAPHFSALLGHTKREKEYFELLILFSRAKSDSETKHYFEKLLSYVELTPLKIEGYKYSFYKKWYHTAIREVVGLAGFAGDYKKLARMLNPPVTESQARQSIKLLLDLGFIKKNDAGQFTLISRFITPGEEIAPVAIREFQKETMRLAIDALDKIPKEERHISTVTLSLSPDGVEKLKACVENFRTEMLRIANKDNDVSQVFQVNVQLFPISRRITGEGNGQA